MSFLSTPSVGRATLQKQLETGKEIFLSTPSVGRATHPSRHHRRQPGISIHALRGEGDDLFLGRFGQPQHISIHALRGEGDAPALGHFSAI